MVKILFDLQISSFNESGKPLIESDSNYLFTSNIMDGLKKFNVECEYLLGNYKHPELDRYFLDNKFIQAISKSNANILWTNDPCKVGAYRTIWNKPLVCYNHWIDTPDSPKMERERTYFWRQLEAMFKADLYLVNSQSGIDSVKKSLECLTTKAIDSYNIARISAVNPPLKADVLKEAINSTPLASKPTIVFNHRLSSSQEYSMNTFHLINLMNKLNHSIGQDNYQVYVSNPSGKNHPILTRPNVVNIYSPYYEEYLKRLAEGWYQVNFFEYDGQWSMAMAEALCLGLEVFYPSRAGYHEMAKPYGEICDPFGYIDVDLVARAIESRPSSTRNWRQSEYFLEKFDSKNIVETQLLPLLAEYF